MTLFQVFFGLAVFAITRDYYLKNMELASAQSPALEQPAVIWPNNISRTEIARLISPSVNLSAIQDPAELSRLANEYFANRQYDKAAEFYERLLVFSPNDVNTLNNLGITLHYLGKTTEALRWLNQGVVVDPDNQRIWLTLGFVNSQLGKTELARAALTTATQIGTDESIRQSAVKMLEDLP